MELSKAQLEDVRYLIELLNEIQDSGICKHPSLVSGAEYYEEYCRLCSDSLG